MKVEKIDNCQVKEKLDDAIKTDIEYQEKISSVKNYWSKLIDKSPENSNKIEKEETIASQPLKQTEEPKAQHTDENLSSEFSVNKIIKSLESVKIVDSIRKVSQTKLQLWKDETEKVKSDSEIEEPPIEKIVKDTHSQQFYSPSRVDRNNTKYDIDSYRETPEIEIVELSCEDNQNQKTQATLIKAKGYEKGCDDFDHVRYKVMKSELFKNSMIANYRKEAQFDGLLQYLQDYSFQELLTNNNIVIIEPVRTKVEPTPRKDKNMDTCKIHPTFLKKNDSSSQIEKSKNAVRRHFFYHPIRVNKEIIEEELPNPDTVKKVRNLFEDTLKMKSPMTHDPPLIEENIGLTRRSTSYRNLSEDMKSNKSVGRKKLIRQLTIDTNFGNKKWDNASLSSGVSSGDLSSNNDYDAEALSPYSNKNIKDVYSSSDEYLCDSANQDFCCESQYVSPDILKKIRDCGTSVTYYGGKVLNSKTGSNVSPMTKAIMDEIKSLQRNCSTSCISCQTKCKGERCACLVADKHKPTIVEKPISEVKNCENTPCQDKQLGVDTFPGFKFKLVKSNSCSSRLELTGTDENKSSRFRFRKQNSLEDPPLAQDEENSVKNKICRLESYSKGQIKAPIKRKFSDEKKQRLSESRQNNETIPAKEIVENKVENHRNDRINAEVTENIKRNLQDKSGNDNHIFEKKFYYVNENLEQNKTVATGKFGEMVFEEFEVLENCYDSLNSNK
ncbi:unnamed protein product [Leptosia nina]|uniref:Uncharacterized protein n=1 Tax=Leptosia nina TaxID=320188 RepID=A0AAV1JTM5_9NEOP